MAHHIVQTAIRCQVINKIKVFGKNQWLIQHKIILDHLLIINDIHNIKLPMLIKPYDWYQHNNSYIGGYLSMSKISYLNLGLIDSIKNHKFRHVSNNYLDAINYLQSQALFINKDYLEGLLNMDMNEFEQQFKFTSNNEEQYLSFNDYFDNKLPIQGIVICEQIMFILFILNCLKDFKLYFVFNIDFRGRIYNQGYPFSFYTYDIFRNIFYIENNSIIDEKIYKLKIENEILSQKDKNIKNSLIGIDACASAFQIIGAIYKDLKMLELTNVISLNNQYDIYEYIMENGIKYILDNKLINFEIYTDFLEKDHIKPNLIYSL